MEKNLHIDKQFIASMETNESSNDDRWYHGCGIGWKSLIDPILEYIQSYNEKCCNDEDKIEVLQIKEKFGGLRIYTDKTTEELEEMMNKAELESFKTCEICGTKENVGQIMTGWIKTCCRKCAEEVVNSRGGSATWRNHDDKTVHEIKRREE